MTALTQPAPAAAAVVDDRDREILARIDRGGLAICEAELRHTLRWTDKQGELLDVLADLERQGLIESALHFRLTDHGRARLPDGYEPLLRVGTGIPWQVTRPSVGRRTRSRSRARA
ncbi:MAG: hypothetical protein ABSG43_02500 [Solirubrobacteraceae bacterium]|jgi:hypothetical protein